MFAVIHNSKEAMQKIWGMTLLERNLRIFSQNEKITEIYILTDTPVSLRKDFHDWNSKKFTEVKNSSEIKAAGKFIFADGNLVFDERLIDNSEDAENSYIDFHGNTEGKFIIADFSQKTLDLIINSDLQKLQKDFSPLKTSDMDSYILKLRRKQEPFILYIENKDDIKNAEDLSFKRSYKGVTDFVTQYIYPPIIKKLVKITSPTNVTPNQLTYISMILSFGSIPLFYYGYFTAAIICGIVMSILDSLDGKLARLTYRTSDSGDKLDHYSDVIYLSFWYICIGLFLADAFPERAYEIHTWNIIINFCYLADRITTGLFKRVYGLELHDFNPVDRFFRRIQMRRNITLVILLTGYAVQGGFVTAFLFNTAWMVISFCFHLLRFIALSVSFKITGEIKRK